MKRKLSDKRIEELEEMMKLDKQTRKDVENAETPAMTEEQMKNKSIVRKTKIKELKAAGYDAREISGILAKGIKDANGKLVKVKADIRTVRRDMDEIEQEYLATDDNVLLRRGEILEKLQYIYKRAMREYLLAPTSQKNPFLGTALSAVKELRNLYGLDTEEAIKAVAAKGQKDTAENHREDISELTEEERNELESALDSLLKNSE